jgi:serine/threonine protein kinase
MASIKAPTTLDALRRSGDKHEVLDLSSESPTVRLVTSWQHARAGPSVTDRTQRWQPLDPTPLQQSGKSHADENALSAFERLYDNGTRLGKGSFGTVFLASCKQSQKRVAVKELVAGAHASSTDIAQEIEVLRALASPHVVATIEAFWSADCTKAYLVQELMGGGELFAWVRSRAAPLTAASMARLSQHLLLGLSHLHANGVLHRDIKPSNLLLSDRSEHAQLRIGDFGLCAVLKHPNRMCSQHPNRMCSREASRELPGAVAGTDSRPNSLCDGESGTGSMGAHPAAQSPDPAACVRHAMVGTPEWMAPEVVLCAEAGAPGYSFASDIWSAGCVVYALLTGREHGPFGGRTRHVVLGAALLTGREHGPCGGRTRRVVRAHVPNTTRGPALTTAAMTAAHNRRLSRATAGGGGFAAGAAPTSEAHDVEDEEDDEDDEEEPPTLALVFERILSGHWRAELVSDYLARDLLSHLLCLTPENRYQPADALTHMWVLLADDVDGCGASAPCSPVTATAPQAPAPLMPQGSRPQSGHVKPTSQLPPALVLAAPASADPPSPPTLSTEPAPPMPIALPMEEPSAHEPPCTQLPPSPVLPTSPKWEPSTDPSATPEPSLSPPIFGRSSHIREPSLSPRAPSTVAMLPAPLECSRREPSHHVHTMESSRREARSHQVHTMESSRHAPMATSLHIPPASSPTSLAGTVSSNALLPGLASDEPSPAVNVNVNVNGHLAPHSSDEPSPRNPVEASSLATSLATFVMNPTSTNTNPTSTHSSRRALPATRLSAARRPAATPFGAGYSTGGHAPFNVPGGGATAPAAEGAVLSVLSAAGVGWVDCALDDRPRSAAAVADGALRRYRGVSTLVPATCVPTTAHIGMGRRATTTAAAERARQTSTAPLRKRRAMLTSAASETAVGGDDSLRAPPPDDTDALAVLLGSIRGPFK